MKTNIRRDGDLWVVETNNRVVPVEHWDTAVRIANGPTGKERKCGSCGDPISRDPYRPVGVKAENRAGYCYSCGGARPPVKRDAWKGKACVGGCGVTLHMKSGAGRGPSTREHFSGGLCSLCYKRDRKGIPLPRDPDYRCVRCDCEVSTSFQPPEGKARAGAGWRCLPCVFAVAHGAPESLETRIMCAGDCGFALRSSTAPITKGTRRSFRNGYCWRCHSGSDEAQPKPDVVPVPEMVDAPQVSAMMAARRARKARQERAEKARAIEYARYLHYKKTRQPA